MAGTVPLDHLMCWHRHEDRHGASEACAEALASVIGEVLAQRRVCHVALPGGGTPVACLERLARMPLPWSSLHWYVGDERCLSPGDPQRNDVMLERHFWRLISTPASQCHRMPAELGPERGASEYSRVIEKISALDIVFLGIGEDGHTASLFPGNPAVDDPAPVVPVHNAPKPPPDRVSLGMRTLRQAGRRIVLATGTGKAEAIARIRHGEALPVSMIGEAQWYVDNAAMSLSDS